MAEKTTKSRAEYLRDYRARKAAANPVEPHVCECCHKPFTPERADARFCSASCRAGRWRRVTHRSSVHDPAGFVLPANRSNAGGLETCFHMSQEPDGRGTTCRDPATWRVAHYRNGDYLLGFMYWCDDHADDHADTLGPCDPDAACHGGSECPADAGRWPTGSGV